METTDNPRSDQSWEERREQGRDRGGTGLCELLDRLHESGSTHGDLTLHNAIWAEDEKAALIDLAGSAELAEMPEPEQLAARADDFSEPYRDLILAQYYIGPLSHPHAQQSLRRIDELFSDEFIPKLRKLKAADWTDEIP